MKRTEYVKLVGNTIVISPEPEEGFYPAEVDYSGVEEWELPSWVKEELHEKGTSQVSSDQA